LNAPDPSAAPPPELRQRLLHGIERILYWSGAGTLYVRSGGVQGAIILMYHSVARAGTERWIDSRNCISADRFEAQMAFLVRRRYVVSMNELVDALEGGRTPPAGTVVLTFDDGYRDTFDTAAPILARYGLPATLYLATGYVERGETQWIDRLYAIFTRRTRHDLELPGQEPRCSNLRVESEASRAYRSVADRLLVATWDDREALLAEVRSQLKPSGEPPRLTLTWDEVGKLLKSHPRFDVGVHTRDHVDLVTNGGDTARHEIHACVADVERELRREVAHFSFPYGRTNDELSRIVSESGLRSAVATEPATLIRSGTNRFAMPRLEAPTDRTLFRFWTSGACPDLPRRLTGRA
jgi:peptidoglycan/xylan/chitin deacetylase (PgdA/CDA1 family)